MMRRSCSMGKRQRKAEAEGERRAQGVRVAGVIAMIARAFQQVQREDGVSLHEADVLDSYGTDSQRAAARRKDVDTSWCDVPAADIEHYHAVFSFLDPKGFRYYIPAYMTWSLRNYQSSRSMTVDSTIYALALHDQAELRDYQLERYSLLTNEEGGAVLAFLRYMAHETDGRVDDRAARDAIRKYWSKFEPRG